MKAILPLLFVLMVIDLNGQIIAKSIFEEYGYPTFPKENVSLHAMFGATKYQVYSDNKYLKISSFQDETP